MYCNTTDKSPRQQIWSSYNLWNIILHNTDLWVCCCFDIFIFVWSLDILRWENLYCGTQIIVLHIISKCLYLKTQNQPWPESYFSAVYKICTQLVCQSNLKPVSKSSICFWNCNLTSSVMEAGTCINVSCLSFCATFSDAHVLSKSTSVPSNWLRIDLRCSSVVNDSSNTKTDKSNWKTIQINLVSLYHKEDLDFRFSGWLNRVLSIRTWKGFQVLNIWLYEKY